MGPGKKEAIGIIPARFASTRFPGKPLALIAGKSLIRRVYENAMSCKALDRIVVATDDERIARHVSEFGGEVILTSSDCKTGTDRLAEVVRKDPHCQEYPIVVNVQGDEPCLSMEAIEKVVELLQGDPTAVSATTVSFLTSAEEAMSSSVVKCVKDMQDNALYFSRSLIPSSKELIFNPKTVYYRHLGLYAYRREFLLQYATLDRSPAEQAEDLEQLRILEHGYRMKVAVVKASGIDVNYPEDIQKVESYLWAQNICS